VAVDSVLLVELEGKNAESQGRPTVERNDGGQVSESTRGDRIAPDKPPNWTWRDGV
jgi:hypothetical protein